MNMKIALVAVAALGLSAPVLAKDSSDKQSEQPKEKKICRTETVTGSLTNKRRICMTQAEWDELAGQSKDRVDRYASRSSGTPGAASNPLSPN